jgi:hypothetical protein
MIQIASARPGQDLSGPAGLHVVFVAQIDRQLSFTTRLVICLIFALRFWRHGKIGQVLPLLSVVAVLKPIFIKFRNM